MAEFKVVISDPKSGKSVQKEVKDPEAGSLIGKKIRETVKGDSIGFAGYEFEITGGSDNAGFPMRSDVPGQARKKILAVNGIGISNKKKYRKKTMKGLRTMKGMRQRKTVAGNTVYEKTAQVNLKIIKQGKENLFPQPAPEAPAEGAAQQAEKKPAQEKKAHDKKKQEK